MVDDELLTNTYKVINKFMIERGWLECRCSACGKNFYLKTSSTASKSSCGWGQCAIGPYSFFDSIKRKRIMSPRQVCTAICEHFERTGFKIETPRNITNLDGDTDLIIAGVQIFDGAIHQNQKICERKMIMAQPCVRMQFKGLVGLQEGISTSFINICTEVANINLGEHLQILDKWYDAFSRLGLHMNDFAIVARKSTNDWGTGKFPAINLFFVYKGLELGDASYFFAPRVDKTFMPISDIGFGLERIVWAINKTNSYFDVLMPCTAGENREMLDSCRTLSLLALCGVRASNNGSGLQYRRFAKVLSEKYYGQDIFYILAYYFDYWSQFIKPTVDKDIALKSIRLEIERYINLKISKALKISTPEMETTEDYFNRLVYNHNNININDLRETIKKCQNQ